MFVKVSEINDERGDKLAKHLSVYLRCENEFNESNWSIKTIYDLSIRSQSPTIEDKTKRFYFTFRKVQGNGGLSIEYEEAVRNEFIKEDKIQLQVYLVADNLKAN